MRYGVYFVSSVLEYGSTFVFSVVWYCIVLDGVIIRLTCMLDFLAQNSKKNHFSATILYLGPVGVFKERRPWQSNFIKYFDWCIGLSSLSALMLTKIRFVRFVLYVCMYVYMYVYVCVTEINGTVLWSYLDYNSQDSNSFCHQLWSPSPSNVSLADCFLLCFFTRPQSLKILTSDKLLMMWWHQQSLQSVILGFWWESG